MATRASLNVSLTPELEQFVHDRVATGRYQTASEVIRDGLRLLENQERAQEVAFKPLKARLEKAAARAEREPGIDPDDVLKELKARARRRAPSSK